MRSMLLIGVVALSPAVATATPVAAGGAFTCDLLVDGTLPPTIIPPEIERDRQLILQDPRSAGYQYKIIPGSFAEDGINLWSGGRYLFDTHAQAQVYEQLIKHDLVTDGVQFLDRYYFLANACYSHLVIGAEETQPVFLPDFSTTRVALRTERWRTQPGDLRAFLASMWPRVRDAALARGLNAVWLLYNQPNQLVTVISFSNRVDPTWQNPPLFDFAHADWATFGKLASMAPLSDEIPFVGNPGVGPWEKVYDRTAFTFTAWPLYQAGDHGPPAQWPNSGPLPAPFCGDGVCVPSQGEAHANCAIDCAPGCGNAQCEVGETQRLCPSDCGL